MTGWMKKHAARLGEIVRYGLGCGGNVLLKVVITAITGFFGMAVWAGYLVTQAVVLLASFFFHYFVTFRRRFTSWGALGKDFVKFTAMVIGIKLVDYFFVVGGVALLEEKILASGAGELARQIFRSGVIVTVSGVIFILRYFLYRMIFHKPELAYYVGKTLQKVSMAHAAAPAIAENGASGGVVTALLTGMLARHEIDGALVSLLELGGAEPAAHGKIVSTPEELKAAQGSIYFDFPLLSQAVMAEIRAFPGKLAIVALPCQISAWRKIAAQEPDLNEKVVLTIGLFCGHASQKELFMRVLAKKGIDPATLKRFRFRRGAWRGNAFAEFEDGTSRSWPTAYYNLYQNLFVLSARRCFGCFDHFAENADISCGDVWCQKYRYRTIKPSMVAVRTARGMAVWARAEQAGDLCVEAQPPEALFAANSRSAIFHKAIAARAKVFAGGGAKISVPAEAAPARWNEIMAAKIIARFAFAEPEKVLKMNRRILKLYLYAMKALTSF